MSRQKMTEEQVATISLSLPGAREDYKWGGIRVCCVDGDKMSAVRALAGAGVSLKVADDVCVGY